ncbi:MAG TPA: S8 family serine peptidase [Phycisphaerae bacterium]|nr:S8 family serine peptidase [Phycisphaerae bacterium]
MLHEPCKVSARAGFGAGIWVALFAGAAMAQTQLSLQETELNVTADHSGNQVVNIHLDSLGPNAAVYGIVGRSDGQAGRAQPGAVVPRVLPAPAIVRYAGAVDWNVPHEPDELIVCYDQQWVGGMAQLNPAPAMRQQKNALHARMGTTFRKEFRLINADVIKVPPGAGLQAVAQRYAKQPGVTFVQPNYIYQAIALPDDPNFPFVPSSLGPPDDQLLWGLHTTAQDGAPIPSDVAFDSDIDAAEAWEVTTGSSDVVVAVIDTGVDYTHPDIVANMWTNAGEIAGNGIDDDGNGFVDDYYGYDFINDDGDPFDDHYHGTHVAGTIGAVGNNGVNIAGVNWNVRIMALKFLGSDGHGPTSAAVECVDYAVLMGAMISNNSWGGGGFDAALLAAINNAGAAGHLFLAAAGNDTINTDIYPHYPSSYDLDYIVSVAATGKNLQLAYFSNYGVVSTDLAAPGLGIYSLQLGAGIVPRNGTSMATPHVAGVAALLKAVRPDAEPLQIKQWILDGVTPDTYLAGKVLTGGRLNAVEPLRLATMPWLRVEDREGILDSSESLTIPVTFITQDVPVGFYSGSLIVLDLSYDNAVTPRIEIPVTMDLQFVELAPLVEDVHQFVVQNYDTTVTLVGRDPNIGQTVDFTIETLPALGTLIDPATGLPISSAPYPLADGADTITYSPAPDQLYTETFQYTATDGTLTSNIGTVTVEVVAPPEAPGDVSAYSGNIFVELNWLPNIEPDLAGYNIHVAPDPGGPYIKITSTPHTDTTFRHYPSGASPTYYVITAVLDNGAEGAYSAEVSGQPTYTSHYAPLNLCATPGYEKVYLEWEAPWEFLGTYRIIRSLHEGGEMLIVGELSDKKTTTFVDETMQWVDGPENGVTYDYYVENWTYWDLWGSGSNLVTVMPDYNTPPTAPTGLDAVGGESFVDVTWDANPELDIDEYWVYRSTTSGGPYYYRGAVNDRRFYDQSVAPFTTYYYVLIAADLDGDESEYSEEVSANTGGDTTPPTAPTNLTATPGDGFVFLDWDDNTEPDFMVYFIYRSTTGGGPYEEVDNDDPSQFPDYSVVNGTTYYYVVTAMDTAYNESGYSNEAVATPQAPVSCTFDWECDDGVYCNGAEACITGECEPGSPVDCDDGVGCTVDSCNEATDSCDNVANDANCDDELYCNGVETCDDLLDCQAGTAPDCADSVACTTDTCNEATDSCDHIPNHAACDDGAFCNGAETCNVTLGCQAGTPVDCDDGVACTDDSCNEGTDSCDNIAADANCDDGLFCNGEETCHATLGCQAGTDPCDGQPCNEDDDTCGGGAEVWMVFTANVTVPGVGTVTNEDIVAYNLGTGTWSLVFDGSDVGLSSLAINGMAALPDGDILLTFTAAGTVGGLSVDDSDIVRFTPTSLGPTTAGAFSFYFDGSDVGLTKNDEDIDAIGLTASGQLIVSVIGNFAGTGASGVDEDLFVFNATSLGSVTAGSFAMYFDGSDVGLNTSSDEDVDAAGLTSSGSILLSTLGSFSVTGVSGDDEDVFEFSPTSLGSSTSGTFQMFLDLSTLGIATSADVIAVELVE